MLRKIFKFFMWLAIIFFGTSVAGVLIYRFVPVYITPLMVIRAVNPQGTAEQQSAERHFSHKWISIDEMSHWMPKAVVASEDGRFYRHNGFDFDEIEKAAEESRAGKRQRGASTISQQTAKNVFLWPAHSWLRKGIEAYFTVLIEFMWPKERILEVYLNSIEMGAGIYGVSAAAEHYFGVPASQLTKRQCALIAVCLPAPLKRDPSHPSAYISRRARTICKYM